MSKSFFLFQIDAKRFDFRGKCEKIQDSERQKTLKKYFNKNKSNVGAQNIVAWILRKNACFHSFDGCDMQESIKALLLMRATFVY